MNVKTAMRLVQIRERKGFSQDELAEKLGVSVQTVASWETGESSPGADELIMLSKLYGVSIDEMLTQDKTEFDARIERKNKRKHLQFEDVYEADRKPSSMWENFPYPIFALIVFLLLGFVWNLWHPGWVIFLTVPVYYATVRFFQSNDKLHSFPFALVVTIIYIALGIACQLWHPGWVIFLTIPIFYSMKK